MLKRGSNQIIHRLILDNIVGPNGPSYVFKYGAPGRIRTSDPLVRSQILYPTELRAH